MENITTPKKFSVTQLTAINIAKAVTLVLLASYALVWGIPDFRQVLYLCLHGSYCLWWLLEQWFFPQRQKQIFAEPVGLVGLVAVILFVGVFYSLPGYLAFTPPY